MKYFVVAGEHSGDMYGRLLLEQIKKLDAATFRGVGGAQMQEAGMELVLHIEELAVMGVWEVLRKALFFRKALAICKEEMIAFQPDALILIDFPGFNLRLAQWAKRRGIKVIYYIPPKLWAWGERRITKLRDSVHHLLLILPFERAFYQHKDIPYTYVGHPLIDVLCHSKELELNISNKNIVAVMPGSRKQEVKKMLYTMLEVAEHFPDYVFVVIKASSLDDRIYQPIFRAIHKRNKNRNIISVRNATGNILKNARLAIVKSGTATLEVALHNVPQIVVYKTSWLTYWMARKFVKIAFISLPNLIAGKKVVPELIQSQMNAPEIIALIEEMKNPESEVVQKMLAGYKKIHKDLDFDLNILQEDISRSDSSTKAAQCIVAIAAGCGA